MNSQHKLKITLFITGVALIAVSMFMPGAATTSFARQPMVIPTTFTPPPPTVITTPETNTPYADPYVLKTASAGEAMPGQTISFVIVAGNKGTVNAVNVQVRDTLPAYLNLTSVTASPRGTVTQSGNSFVVDIGDLAPGELITINVSAQVNEQGKPGDCINVSTLNTTSEGDNPNNNIAVAQCLIGQLVAPPTGGDFSSLPLITMLLGGLLLVISLFMRRSKPA
jgi:uncharacterized repeat protein (TIGR01451 family)